MSLIEKAVILAEGVFNTKDAKTGVGLVRFSMRYQIVGVIDSTRAGMDAGEALNGKQIGIPVYSDLDDALSDHPDIRSLLVGANPIGNYLLERQKSIIRSAIQKGLDIVNGLHIYMSEDKDLSELADRKGVRLTDVRKIFNDHKIFFSGKIDEVDVPKIAVLGTDSAIGKRSTAITLHQTFEALGRKSAFVGMGQTGWMQGFEYCIVMDAIVNDFVAGAIEDVIWRAWRETTPDVIVTHGEGSILHPAYPGGFELIAAGRPDIIILHHDPVIPHFNGFPQYTKPELGKFIEIIRLLSDKTPIAITLNSEGLTPEIAFQKAEKIAADQGIPVKVPFHENLTDIANLILNQT